MKGSLVRFACIAILMQLSCNAAHAVTWFDSNIRPDGVGDSSQSSNVYMAPSEDGTQIVYGNIQDGESVADAFDSSAGE